MVRRCVAGYCSRETKDGVSLHLFPREAAIKEKWDAFILRTRKDWAGGSATSLLCSAHFEEGCFETLERASLMESFGIPVGKNKQRKLKPDAVPSIILKPAKQTLFTAQGPPAKQARGAYQKRERKRVSMFFQSL